MKNKSRKIIAVLLAVLLLCLVGCRESENATKTPSESRIPTAESTPTASGIPEKTPENTELSKEELAKINKMREDYAYGTCKNLKGEVSVVLFYMDDFESSWTKSQIDDFTEKEIEPGLEFLEKQAKRHGVELDLKIQRVYSSVDYADKVITDIRSEGYATADVLWQAARQEGYGSDKKMIKSLRTELGTDEAVCFTIFNKEGTAYAINPKRGSDINVEEHCIVFSRDIGSSESTMFLGYQSSVIAHEMLHLFGAEDFYDTASRKALAKKHYPSDIMLAANYNVETNNIDAATAFYVGWTNEVPEVLYDKSWG